MPRVRENPLLDSDTAIMDVLIHYRYATREQLGVFAGLPTATVYRRVDALVKSGMLVKHPAYKPEVIALSNKGYRVRDKAAKTKWLSPAKIQQFCHRNAALIALREHHQDVQLYPMMAMYRNGLSPSVAEYGVRLDNIPHLLMVDDYYMRPKRIKQSWERKHKAPDKFFNEASYIKFRDQQLLETAKTNNAQAQKYVPDYHWNKKTQGIWVFSTDSNQVKKHQRFIEKERLPARVGIIAPLWNYSV